jgi:solute carrier family 25 phosphate transporter 23/24/25/41
MTVPGRAVELSLGSKAISRIKDVFNSIDTDRSGRIDRQEFRKACEELSLSLTDEEINQCFESDKDRDGRLDFEEYTAFIFYRLQRTFQDIDRNDTGTIDINELRDVLQQLGTVRQITDREVRAMFARVDVNKNGEIDFREFSDFFAYLPDPSMVSVAQQWAEGVSVDVGADFAPPPLPPSSLPLYQFLMAGGLAGVASRTATAPLERVKLLAQTQRLQPNSTVMSSILRMWQSEGARGLFAGNGANVARVFPYAALICLTYSNLCKLFPAEIDEKYEPLWRMAAGATAGIFATLLTHPLDVARARLTVQVKDKGSTGRAGIRQTFATLIGNSGVRGLYKGLSPTLLAIAPFLAVQQSSYDYMKTAASKKEWQPSVTLFACCGITAGTLAQTVVYPLDVIRRQMQVSSDHNQLIAGFVLRLGLIGVRVA